MNRPPPIRLVVLLPKQDAGSARAQQVFERLRRDWFQPELWLMDDAAKPAQLVRRLRQNRPDLLCVCGAPPNVWGRLCGALLGIPVVVGYYGLAPCRYERLLRRFSTRILTDTTELRDILTRRFGVEPKQITVVSDNRATNRCTLAAAEERSQPTIDAAELRRQEEPSVTWMVRQTEQVFLEVAQRGTAWTTTCDGHIPLEVKLGPDDDTFTGPDTIEERGKFRPDRSVRRVARPSITVFLPAPDRATGIAAIICPGGGYAGVTIDKEGFDVARWLNTFGVAGIVLKYRLPCPERTKSATPMPMEDLTRAFGLVRGHAREWNIDADRVGAMGFSAGGHVAAAATQAGDSPAFQILVYPVISMQVGLAHRGSRRKLLGRSPPPALVDYYSLERHVTSQTPPTFLVHARDDASVDINNSIQYAEALRKAAVPHELLIYERGGHGFGLGSDGEETSTWLMQCMSWLQSQYLLKSTHRD